MRIIQTDNFDRDFFQESFVLGHMTEPQAIAVCAVINEQLSTEHGPYYYRVVNDDYMLTRFEP